MHNVIYDLHNLVQPSARKSNETAIGYNQSVKFCARTRDKALSDDINSAIKRFEEVTLEGIDHRPRNSPRWVLQ